MCTCMWVYVRTCMYSVPLLLHLMFTHNINTLLVMCLCVPTLQYGMYIYLLCMPIFDSPSWIEVYIVMVVVMCCACVVNNFYLQMH